MVGKFMRSATILPPQKPPRPLEFLIRTCRSLVPVGTFAGKLIRLAPSVPDIRSLLQSLRQLYFVAYSLPAEKCMSRKSQTHSCDHIELRILAMLAEEDEKGLHTFLAKQHPADIADVIKILLMYLRFGSFIFP
jgi:hypothetical protein